MKNIKLMNKIAAIGTDRLDRAKYNVGDDIANPDAIMVRSAALHDLEFNPELVAIARCGAGVNNIPVERCSEAGIPILIHTGDYRYDYSNPNRLIPVLKAKPPSF